MRKAVLDRQLSVSLEVWAIHRLKIELQEVARFERLGLRAFLRVDKFEFISSRHDRLRSCLRADTDPVESTWGRERAVGLDGDLEATVVEGGDRCLVELKQGFPPCADYE